jgi:hypothetical protein
MKQLWLATCFVISAVGILHAQELTMEQPQGDVHPIQALRGKAPNERVRVYIVVNPVEAPGQYWVQDEAVLDGRGHWTCDAHFGEAIPAHDNKQFRVAAFADRDLDLKPGLYDKNGWPRARWHTDPIVVRRASLR